MAATEAAAAEGAHYEHSTGTTRIILTGTESHENPFTADGELSKKAEYIIRHSTISRSEIRISDPDLHKAKAAKEEAIQRTEVATSNSAPPPYKDRENGKVEVSPKDVEVEVAAANASQPQPQQAEQVKVKGGSKCKCCVVM